MARVLLITGSSGIAAATAKLASERGHAVFVIGKASEECKALCRQIEGSAYALADVADENQLRSGLAECLIRFGTVDAVFNVAGLSGRSLGDGPLHECTTEAWQTLMSVHAGGTFFVCREAIKHWMAERKPGVILNMGSVLARFPEPTFFATHAYAASKGTIESMTLAAAGFYAPHKIRLNVIAPALVRTPMSERAQTDPEILDFMKHKQPLKAGLIDAEEVARVACFLLSEESFPITGEVVRVDAGWAVTG